MSSRAIKPASFVRRLTLPLPSRFRFLRTVMSHGWFDLPPFVWSPEGPSLSRTLDLPAAGVALVTMSPAPEARDSLAVTLSTHRAPTAADLRRTRADIAHMLRLDEDLEAFYRRAQEVDRPDLRWAGETGAGRLLRSPSVYEDLVKMICTTNCSWALTKVMTRALVERLGEPAPGGARAFPAPSAMADASPRFYRDIVRCGYRGPFLRVLARQVAGGALDPESWLGPGRDLEDVRLEILAVPGAGPYVADNMLKLLGRYDGLGLDSWCRRKFSRLYHRGRVVTDRTIVRFYEPFGPWRGLALWCDLTKDWLEAEGSGTISAW